MTYCGGPDASRTLTLCRAPAESMYASGTDAVGFCLSMIVVSELGEVTDWPPSEVMVSPAPRPACEAGEPDTTDAISAPEDTGAEPNPPPPNP